MPDARKKVVLLGKGDLAIAVAEWFHDAPGYELAFVVPVIPEPGWTGSLSAWARGAGVSIVESGHYRDLPAPPAGGWDLAFSVFYDKIIRQGFIDCCKRILNLHNGPLPRYRGVSPINWALKNGEDHHGVTIHEITAGVDDGPIVAQSIYSIYLEFDEVRAVLQRATAYGWTLFQQTMPLIDQIVARQQDHEVATFYHSRDNDKLGERRYFTRAESLAKLG